MKTEFKAKFLNHLIQRKQDEKGFTLIELLVVIIIIGILAAIALPAFLNQANKAKQSEAKTYVGSMNRAQQAYYLEKAKFVDAGTNVADFGLLGLGIPTQTANYKYTTNGSTTATVITNQAQLVATTAPLKAYIGGVQIGTVTATKEATTQVVLCEAKDAGVAGGASGTEVVTGVAGSAPTCNAAYDPL